jgi:hypothetical protein
MVLCPGKLPKAVPRCEAIAQALDVEIEEFSMYAIPGPSPSEIAPGELAGPGVPFVLWVSAEGQDMTLHVYQASGRVEISKTVDPGYFGELPTAYDMAILFKNLMGTSLYADLATLYGLDAELMALAIPEEKEEAILARAAAGKGKVEISNIRQLYLPQLHMGWALVTYDSQNNLGSNVSDVYNGLYLSLRFPFMRKAWAGVSLVVTQTIGRSFNYEVQISPTYSQLASATFKDSQVLLSATAAWYTYLGEHLGVWIGGGPGITSSTVQLHRSVPDNSVERESIIRMVLSGSAGLQIMAAARVRFEVGLRLGYIFTLKGDDTQIIPLDSYRKTSPYYESGSFQLTTWLTMGFG